MPIRGTSNCPFFGHQAYRAGCRDLVMGQAQEAILLQRSLSTNAPTSHVSEVVINTPGSFSQRFHSVSPKHPIQNNTAEADCIPSLQMAPLSTAARGTLQSSARSSRDRSPLFSHSASRFCHTTSHEMVFCTIQVINGFRELHRVTLLGTKPSHLLRE